MKMAVPCSITYSAEDAVWYVESPDMYSGLITYGETLDEAKAMAADALTGLIEVMIDYDEELPPPSTLSGPDIYPIELPHSLSFAIWLRAKRKASGLSVAELAERLGVKIRVYKDLENPAIANPSLETLKRLEKVFGEEIVLV
ncbi:MAG: type II toxin-antitoxin system HicB family antitoxin [Spirochaetota bacterium]